jgi:tRNA (adenine37-N6)-methyltransferase
MTFYFKPIGIIRSPFKDVEGMPIQSAGAQRARGEVELFPEYVEGLKDLDGFSHIILLYHFHLAKGPQLTVTPFLDSVPRGVFATRAPLRPNAIGLSVVRLVSVRGAILDIENVDIADGAPLLDIKPYVPEFDYHPAERIGWLQEAMGKVRERVSDSRFK